MGDLAYFDNDLVAVDSQTPHAGPRVGGTTIELHGQARGPHARTYIYIYACGMAARLCRSAVTHMCMHMHMHMQHVHPSQGFYDTGDTVCMFCAANIEVCTEGDGLLRTIPATVISTTYATCETSNADAMAVCPDSAQCRETRVGISLSGQANALRTAATAEDPRAAAWCFVDLI